MPNPFSFSPTESSIAVVLFNLFVSAFVALLIAFVHRKTHTGLSYSQSFFATLVLTGIIATIVLMTIQNSIYGALGLLGAFAFIRFRTIIKETRDIAFLFFVLAEGVAVGLNNYALALTSTAFLLCVSYLLSKYKVGFANDSKFILLLTAASPLQEEFAEKLKGNGIASILLNSKKHQDNTFEYTLSLKAKSMNEIHTILARLAPAYSIMKFDILSGRETIEY